MLPRTLFGRLLLVFLGFGVVMTTALLFVMQGSHLHYHLEADQTVNRSLARSYVDANFLVTESPLTAATLHEELVKLSATNPDVDIYLVDGTGGLVAASVPESEWRRRQVALQPIEQFLAGAALPILGQDPREPGHQEVFSAAPIAIQDCPAKYLYIVLHRGEHAVGASQLRARYALGEGIGIMLLAAALAVALSLVVLRLLTQRLSTLERAMQRFEAGDTNAVDPHGAGAPSGGGDEVDRLAALCRRFAIRIRAQVRALESTDRNRREMLANVSHDLRTPLTTLQTHLETLVTPQSALTPAEEREYISIALKQSRRLGALVEQLLEVAKLDAQQVVARVEPFPLTELLHDIAQKFALVAHERDVLLLVEAPRDTPWVVADIGLIERVLDNLIENALRYSRRGGRTSVALSARGERVRVSVRDDGPGLSAEDCARIFDRFYRKSPARTPDGSHAGLGLAIVKSILELHDTAINVDSAPGAGAEFWFELPAHTPASGTAGTRPPRRSAGADLSTVAI